MVGLAYGVVIGVDELRTVHGFGFSGVVRLEESHRRRVPFAIIEM